LVAILHPPREPGRLKPTIRCQVTGVAAKCVEAVVDVGEGRVGSR